MQNGVTAKSTARNILLSLQLKLQLQLVGMRLCIKPAWLPISLVWPQAWCPLRTVLWLQNIVLYCIEGLRPGSLTKAERIHFGSRSADYLEARFGTLHQ